MFKLKLFPDKCTGCRTCEIACSYHHVMAFNRKISSIEVKRFVEEGLYEPVIYKEAVARRKACDLCEGEEMPLCVKYCAVEAIRL